MSITSLSLAPGLTIEQGFISFPASDLARESYAIGSIPGLRKYTICHRYEPFWMTAKAGTRIEEIPTEVQYLLAQSHDGSYLLMVPLVDGLVRASLEGGSDGLVLVAETGDSKVPVHAFRGLYVATGGDPFALLKESAAAVSATLPFGRLRSEKSLPGFTDRFGWCTWDAFYADVSQDKVRTGLESFRTGGVTPRYLILDDGWLSTKHDAEDRSHRLTSFEANEKFPGGLSETVQMAKEEFGLQEVIAWHAMTGYWGGVDTSFPGYSSKIVKRACSPGIKAHVGEIIWWGDHIGLIPNNEIYRFFQDFHRHLRSQGIDGVKVDVQAQLEIVSEGSGGRVRLMTAYHEALEGSIQTQFQGNLINCMSCAAEMLYGASASNLTRTSTDFWPDKPESHGLHLYVNAQVSAWFGEFIHPDWDMFQSGHVAGAFHAAGRAVSGGPVYVSDKPGAQDFDVLRSLVLPNGDVLRAIAPGRPTQDCLLDDPTKEDVLLKIFAPNRSGGVVGAFNARYSPDSPVVLSGTISPSDVDGIVGEDFAVRSISNGEVRKLKRDEKWLISLAELGWEVFTVVPIINGFGLLGLSDKLNGGGVVTGYEGETDIYTVSHGGEFVVFAELAPSVTLIDGSIVPVEFDISTTVGVFHLPTAGPHKFRITVA